jgi:dihydrofolate reductase
MIISMIAAMSENRVIGYQGRLPWIIPEDLARFRAITMGHVVVMGRKTFESIGHPLPGRTNVVLSRMRAKIDGCVVVSSLQEAIAAADGEEELFICGGGEVFREALPLAHRLYLTIVHREYPGEVIFPEVPEPFVEVHREEIRDTSPPCSFVIFEKVEQVDVADNPEQLCRKGLTALKRELYYLARSCFEQAAELDDSPEILSFLALSIVKSSGDFMVGLKFAKDAAARAPENLTICLNLGKIEILAGHKEAALTTFRKGVQLGGGEEFFTELAKYGNRIPPPIQSLPRSHFLNKYLGLILQRLGIR